MDHSWKSGKVGFSWKDGRFKFIFDVPGRLIAALIGLLLSLFAPQFLDALRQAIQLLD